MEMLSDYEKKPWKNSYPPGLSTEIEIPLRSIGKTFDETADRWKNKTAIIFYGRKISYKELKGKVHQFANGLRHLGVKKGDRVGLLVLNSPDFLIAFHAIVMLGAICTPMSPVYSTPEIKHQLEDSRIDTLICQNLLWVKVAKTGIQLTNVIFTDISDSLPLFKKLFGKSILRAVYHKGAISASDLPTGKGFYLFREILANSPADAIDVEIDPKTDVAIQPYTGGTTGLPKGVMTTHHNLLSVDMIMNAFYPFEDGGETIIGYMPYYHIGGLLWGVIIAILRGWTQVIMTTPQIDDILNAVVDYKVTWFGGAPAMYEMLNNHDKTDMVKWKKLKLCSTGADALQESTAQNWKARTGVTLQNWWGATELVAGTCTPLEGAKPNSIGIPLPNFEVAVLDPVENRFLPVGEIGEICVIGPGTLKGYWNHPEALAENSAVINDKTWFRSGDLGLMDSDGHFFIYDRKKDLIKYKGLRIHSREVEEVINLHPQVKEAGVIGINDVTVGQIVKAFVVLEKDARGKLSEADIMAYCKEHLADYKVPKIITFLGELPKTDVGKVSRRELRELEV
ncbi:AMP-binding protein [bacterium]|nr:AMP-binding protein [bacterium]